MKETAVDFLFQKLWDNPKDKLTWYKFLIDAKEMERQQIVEAHGRQLKKTQTAGNYEYWLTGEKYYRENYGQ
jgi:hypothetical protein